jgi:thiamine-phosphate pyrophosphorylase
MENAREKLRDALTACHAYPILDTTTIALHGLEKWLDAILGAGVRVVQLRLKDSNDAYFRYVARRFIDKCREFKAISIINDRLEIALNLEAGGVHLGLEDALIIDARAAAIRKFGARNNFVIGGSARTVDRARALADTGAAYLGCGACFPTKTKMDTVYIGIPRLAEIAKSVLVPIVAIGGIDWENYREVLAAGALGFAAISMYHGSLDETAARIAALIASR